MEVLLNENLSPLEKGMPAVAQAITLRGLGTMSLALLDGTLPTPIATIRRSALISNRAWMREFLAFSGCELSPHGKTTMCPQLFQDQLDDGCWGITVATAHQLHVCSRFNVPRVLVANQIAGRQNIAIVVQQLKRRRNLEIYTLVDSEASLNELVRGLADLGAERPVKVLLELGILGGRAGLRADSGLRNLLDLVERSEPWVKMAGIEGFEGIIVGEAESAVPSVRKFVRRLVDVASGIAELPSYRTKKLTVSVGGSAYLDIVAEELAHVRKFGWRPLLRGGCYLTSDSGYYESLCANTTRRMRSNGVDIGDLHAALEVWGQVQSIPEPDLAIVNVGRRDAGTDIDFPVAIHWFRAGQHDLPEKAPNVPLCAMNDQHSYLRAPWVSKLSVGDYIGFGISHPCTTFDKWRILYEVDDDYRVVRALRTFF